MSASGDVDQLAALRYRGRWLDRSIPEFHAAVDALEADTVPESYYLRVLASRRSQGLDDDQVQVLEVVDQPGRDPAPVQASQGELFDP